MKRATLFLAGILIILLGIWASYGRTEVGQILEVNDPVLTWNTFVGGESWEEGYGIAVDPSGNSYICGFSAGTWGSPIRSFSGPWDAFVAKVDPNGNVLWNTFLGAPGINHAIEIAADASGNVYVTGWTEGWPEGTWGDPIRPFGGGRDAFVAKLDTNGTLLWNTFLGGANHDEGFGITVDSSGNIFATGWSLTSWGNPINPYVGGAYVAKLDNDGNLIWHTFQGGGLVDQGHCIVVNPTGDIFVTGFGGSNWGNPPVPYIGGDGYDGIVFKLDANGSLQWNTFLGGWGSDEGTSISLDTSGNVLLTGQSTKTWGSPLLPFGGNCDTYVAKLDENGNLQWNTFLGDSGLDAGRGIVVDLMGNSYITGISNGVSKLNANGSLQWTTLQGGLDFLGGQGIALDRKGTLYVVGAINETWGSPIVPFGGWADAFIVKISLPTIYLFEGFAQPIENQPVVNHVKAGSTVPIKWLITDRNGIPISNPDSFQGVTSYNVNCGSFSTVLTGELEEYSAGQSGLQYLGDGYWQFNWNTAKSYTGQCRVMVLKLADGSEHTAYFKFK